MPLSLPATPSKDTRKQRWLLVACVLLLVWFVFVEVFVQLWYSRVESRQSLNPVWSLTLPTSEPSFQLISIPERSIELLKCDFAQHAAWLEASNNRWEVFLLCWNPGRTAGYLAKLHTPQTCLPAVGLNLKEGPEMIQVEAGALTLPFQRYVFESSGHRLDVFYCRWSNRGKQSLALVGNSGWKDRVRAILEGRGRSGQKVLEVVLWDYPDSASAEDALRKRIPHLVVAD